VIFLLAQAASVATLYAFTLPRDPTMWGAAGAVAPPQRW